MAGFLTALLHAWLLLHTQKHKDMCIHPSAITQYRIEGFSFNVTPAPCSMSYTDFHTPHCAMMLQSSLRNKKEAAGEQQQQKDELKTWRSCRRCVLFGEFIAGITDCVHPAFPFLLTVSAEMGLLGREQVDVLWSDKQESNIHFFTPSCLQISKKRSALSGKYSPLLLFPVLLRALAQAGNRFLKRYEVFCSSLQWLATLNSSAVPLITLYCKYRAAASSQTHHTHPEWELHCCLHERWKRGDFCSRCLFWLVDFKEKKCHGSYGSHSTCLTHSISMLSSSSSAVKMPMS